MIRKLTMLAVASAMTLGISSVNAALLASDDFSTYTTGNISGQPRNIPGHPRNKNCHSRAGGDPVTT